MAGRGRGRGRDMTLPAWMTAPGGLQPPPASPKREEPQKPPATSSSTASSSSSSSSITAAGYRGVGYGGYGNGSSGGGNARSAPRGVGTSAATAPSTNGQLDPNDPSAWSVHVNAGRTYYYNKVTRKSTYEKPEALKSQAEKSLPPTPWKAHTSGGKTYYHNSETNKSVWVEPKELKLYKAKLQALQAGLPLPTDEELLARGVGAPAPAPAATPSTAAAGASTATATATASAAGAGGAAAAAGARPAGAPPGMMMPPPGMMMPPRGMMMPPMMPPMMMGMMMPGAMASAAAAAPVDPYHVPVPDTEEARKAQAVAARALRAFLDGEDIPGIEPDAKQKAVHATAAQAPNYKAVIRTTPLLPRPTKRPERKQYTPEQATELYKKTLHERGVTSKMDWAEAMKLVMNSEAWIAVRSLELKKQLWEEYRTAHEQVEREEAQARRAAAATAFQALLASTPGITGSTRWREAKDLLGDKPEFKAVEESRDREDMFDEYTRGLARAEREEQEKVIAAATAKYTELLQELVEAGTLTHETRWHEFVDNEAVAADERSKALDATNRRRAFRGVMAKLEEAEKERKLAEEAERQRVALELAEKFRELVKAKASEGVFTALSVWKDSQALLEESEEYKALAAVPRPPRTPQSVFDEVVNSMYTVFRPVRRLMRTLLRDAEVKVLPDSKLEEVAAKLIEWEKAHAAPEEGEEPAAAADAGAAGAAGGEAGAVEAPAATEASAGAGAGAGAGEGETAAAQANGDGAAAAAVVAAPFAKAWATQRDLVALAFSEHVATAVEEAAREQARLERRLKRYRELLEYLFYRSDHVGTAWEKAQRSLRSDSAYKDMRPYPEQRRAAFDEHMAKLAEAMPATLKKDDGATGAAAAVAAPVEGPAPPPGIAATGAVAAPEATGGAGAGAGAGAAVGGAAAAVVAAAKPRASKKRGRTKSRSPHSSRRSRSRSSAYSGRSYSSSRSRSPSSGRSRSRSRRKASKKAKKSRRKERKRSRRH